MYTYTRYSDVYIFVIYIYCIFLACLWYRNTEESCTKLLCGKVVWSDTIWQNLIWSPCWENQTTGRIYVDWIGSVLEVVEFSLMNLLSTEHFNSSLWSNGMWHFFPNRVPQIRLWSLQIAGQIYFQPLVRADLLKPEPGTCSVLKAGPYLVGGIPTPLKNTSQLGWWNSRIYWKITFMFQNHQPDMVVGQNKKKSWQFFTSQNVFAE